MVRLQKIAYEKIVNSNVLGRARQLTTPAKWFTTNPVLHNRKLAQEFFQKTILGRLLLPFFRLWHNNERSWQRDLFLQRGLTFEDSLLHTDVELRRDVLFEHMVRESCHPYHYILKARRRERYWRIERGNRGFFVPDFIRNEAKTQTYRDFQRLFLEWKTFKHENYMSDMTPTARSTVMPQIFSIDRLLNYGIWREEAWQRYFLTERDESWYTQKQVEYAKDPKKYPYDLTTAEGKSDFESEIKAVNEKHPGLVAPEGEKFDFKKYYAEIGL